MIKFYSVKSALMLFFVLCSSLTFARHTAIPSPTIESFSPASGPAGTLVTISGSSLAIQGTLTIAGKEAIVMSYSETTIIAMVMPGATNGIISLTTELGTTNSTGSFTVTASQVPDNQVGFKWVGTSPEFMSRLGASVALSADGTTAIVGESNGASIYVKLGISWMPQGAKLIGDNNLPYITNSAAVSISADGNSAIIGNYSDDLNKGAIWFFER